jgi:hypothetical protein
VRGTCRGSTFARQMNEAVLDFARVEEERGKKRRKGFFRSCLLLAVLSSPLLPSLLSASRKALLLCLRRATRREARRRSFSSSSLFTSPTCLVRLPFCHCERPTTLSPPFLSLTMPPHLIRRLALLTLLTALVLAEPQQSSDALNAEPQLVLESIGAVVGLGFGLEDVLPAGSESQRGSVEKGGTLSAEEWSAVVVVGASYNGAYFLHSCTRFLPPFDPFPPILTQTTTILDSPSTLGV